MIKDKIGKIEISRKYLMDETGMFECFNPIHIEQKTFDIWVYTCASELFDRVYVGEDVPYYEVLATRHEPKGIITWDVNKM